MVQHRVISYSTEFVSISLDALQGIQAPAGYYKQQCAADYLSKQGTLY